MSLGQFLPFNLNRLLDHLSTQSKRDYLMEKIDQHKFDSSHTQVNIKNFIKLFILDESSKESCVKEEQARIVESSLQAVNEKERIANRLIKRKRGIKRLDSIFLDQLTIDLLNKNFNKRTSLVIEDRQKLVKELELIKEDYVSSETSSEILESDSEESESKNFFYPPEERRLTVEPKKDTDNYLKTLVNNAKEKGRTLAFEEMSKTSHRSFSNSAQL